MFSVFIFFFLPRCCFVFFFALCHVSSLFSHSARGQGRTTAIYCKMGNFTPTPSARGCNPVRDFPVGAKKSTQAVLQGVAFTRQPRVYPYPLGAGSARPNPKMGSPDPETPLFLGFSVLKGGLRPWSRNGADHGVGVDPETVTLRGCKF